MLFKKNVVGTKFLPHDYFHHFSIVERNLDRMSNLAKYLYEHPEFKEYTKEHLDNPIQESVRTIKLGLQVLTTPTTRANLKMFNNILPMTKS